MELEDDQIRMIEGKTKKRRYFYCVFYILPRFYSMCKKVKSRTGRAESKVNLKNPLVRRRINTRVVYFGETNILLFIPTSNSFSCEATIKFHVPFSIGVGGVEWNR